MIRAFLLLATLLSGGISVAFAQDGSAADACDNATSNVELGGCLSDVYTKVDAELNRVFINALKAIDDNEDKTVEQRAQWKDALRKAQRGWITYKDTDCGEVTGWEWFGGSGAGTATTSCLIAKTEARTKELKDRYGQN